MLHYFLRKKIRDRKNVSKTRKQNRYDYKVLEFMFGANL